MPLGLQESALLAAGSALMASSVYFYRAKQTLPFKASYFLTWPVLGSAIILAVQPARSTDQVNPDLEMLHAIPTDLKTGDTAELTVRLLNDKLSKTQE